MATLTRLFCSRAFLSSAPSSGRHLLSDVIFGLPQAVWVPPLSGWRQANSGSYVAPMALPCWQSYSAQRQEDASEEKTSTRERIWPGGRGFQSQCNTMFAATIHTQGILAAPTRPPSGSITASRSPERELSESTGLPSEVPELYPPAQAYMKNVASGVEKAESPPLKILTLGVLAGAFIGFGAFLAMSIGGMCPGIAEANPGLQKMIYGAFGLPFGLLMTMVCGADLFTGNTATVTAAVIERKAQLKDLAKSWGFSYIGNLAGASLLVGIVTATGLLATSPAPIYLASTKTSLAFSEAFARGILANWLVCIGVWQANAAKSLASKAVGIWFPISAFVALGLEHSVANMFIIPMGIAVGADVTYMQFVESNLIPVTLGNVVGGAAFVATPYAIAYGRLQKHIR